jgi:hypothetical protein
LLYTGSVCNGIATHADCAVLLHALVQPADVEVRAGLLKIRMRLSDLSHIVNGALISCRWLGHRSQVRCRWRPAPRLTPAAIGRAKRPKTTNFCRRRSAPPSGDRRRQRHRWCRVTRRHKSGRRHRSSSTPSARSCSTAVLVKTRYYACVLHNRKYFWPDFCAVAALAYRATDAVF